MMSFHRLNWENPEIDDPGMNHNSSRQDIHSNCAPWICSPEPGVWTWGVPVPTPSLEKQKNED
ncbi:hypothetical protein SDC9_22932 [bioreactor metagenome]|uniref:Uncharacterized protein n=1 Tax=bioreactor metagenome TaxID=1076179 RepID=A0A644UDZ5_9ZZZZ|nr:hypothetical protein [Negativicutes bacterium]